MQTTLGSPWIRVGIGGWLLCCGVMTFATAFAGCGGDDGDTPTPMADAGHDAYVKTECDDNSDCDDGIYCNGAETCDATDPNADPVTHCVAGVAVTCGDGIACTVDTCDEASRTCVSAPPDVDRDGHPDADCLGSDGEPLGDDCDDNDANRFPGNTESCDPDGSDSNHDEDCNPLTFGDTDVDNDTHVDDRCCNLDADGTSHCGDDCNDLENSAFGGATEVCDNIDNDCDPAHAIDNGLFCGACECSVPNATPNCIEGATLCTVGVCDTGFLNCDMNSDNGCESRRDVDWSCGQCNNVCTPNASCGDAGDGTFACACDPGFIGDGLTCDNIDECAEDNEACDSLTTCTDAVGSYTCSACPPGYSGDGKAGCDPALISLSFSFNGLSPVSDPQSATSVVVPITIASLSFTPTVASGVSVAIDSQAATPNAPWFTPTLMLGPNVFTIEVAQVGRPSRTYTLTITRRGTIDYLKASNTDTEDFFGESIAIDGDTIVVGAPGESSNATSVNGNQSDNSEEFSGAAYVFVRTASGWQQQAYLKPSNTETYDYFGNEVAISGDTIVVAADEESSASPTNPQDNNAFVAGAVFVFVRTGSTWTQQAYLKAPDPDEYDFFGSSLAIDGNTVVVTARGDDSSSRGVGGDPLNNGRQDSGAAFVFVRSGSTWSRQAFLKADNADANDGFGDSVAISGNTIVVGAAVESGGATSVNGDGSSNTAVDSGAAYVFVRSGTAWSQQAYLKAENAQAGDYFGFSVDIDGDTIAVGADGEDSGNPGINPLHNDNSEDVGAAYVFVRSGTTWTQQAYLKASNAQFLDLFGNAVTVEGDVIAVGTFGEDSGGNAFTADPDDDSALGSGAVYIYTRRGTTWSETSYLKAPVSETEDYFGARVAMSRGVLVIGAPNEDSDATGVNGSQTNNNSFDSGAVYVFR